jgi:hypothetical protein
VPGIGEVGLCPISDREDMGKETVLTVLSVEVLVDTEP